VRWGIPDLRPPGVGDPYLTLDEDLRAAERLANHAARVDFASLMSAYYETNARVPPSQARRFSAGAIAARGRAAAVLAQWAAMHDAPPTGALLVDAGCGTGPLSLAAHDAGFQVVALDVGLRWLVLAAARAREAGVRLTMACAAASAMPLADASADVVSMESLLENVVPPEPVVRDIARVVRPGGLVWCTTANRWSVGPDPHLGVPWSGWWPSSLSARYARWRGQVPPVRGLFSASGLRVILEQHGFHGVTMEPAVIDPSQRASAPVPIRVAVDAYGIVARSRPGRKLLTLVGPTLVAAAVRDPVHPAAS
jgi:ubiquinone/menaquinone biosynthesis C-methylase UbiE